MPVNVFGAGAVQTAYVSYLLIDLVANPGNVKLVWPTSYVNVPYSENGINYNVLAASMQVNTAIANAYTITLPNATQASVGANFIFINTGAAPVNILYQDGTLLFTANISAVNSYNSYWVQLTNNSTANGVWQIVNFGAQAAPPIVAGLAGYGLKANANTLETNTVVTTTSVSGVVNIADRAKLFVWQGGSGTLTLPSIAGSAGFDVSFNNEGSGTLTILPAAGGATIDNAVSLIMAPGQSVTCISDGTNWWTLGFGNNQFAVVDSASINASGGNITLSLEQASNLIIKLTGNLTANVTVTFPNILGNWYIINNATLNGYSLTITIVNNTNAPYVLGQGAKDIYYSDGTGLYNIPVTTSTVPPFPNGTPALPSITFTADTSTGFCYVPAAGLTPAELVAAVGSTAIGKFTSAGLAITGGLTLSGGLTITGGLTLNTPLSIVQGGTGQNTAALAINALLPAAVANNMLLYNGTNWVVIAPPNPASTLTLKSVSGVIGWVA